MGRNKLYLIMLFIEAVWLLGIIGAPFLSSVGLDSLSRSFFASYSRVCHQKAERSIFIFGGQMAVCARCFGIYLGFLVGTIALPMYSKIENVRIPDAKLVLLSAIPLAIDGLTQLTGFRESNNELRLLTGFLFGLIVISYLIPLALVRLGACE